MIEVGSVSFGSNGNQTISLNDITGTPTGVMFFTGGPYGVNETTNARQGSGAAYVNYQTATAILTNNSGRFTRVYPGTDCFVILDGSSGNETVRGDFLSFGSGQINVHITNSNASFQVYFVAWDS